MYQHILTTLDTHTAGEPTRVVVAGVPFLHGTMAEKRRQLHEEHDFIRTTLMHEPRGHADMFGAIIVEPERPEADIGVVFMDTGGYLAMCGHGSIGVVVAALATGLVPLEEPVTEVLMDTPAGLVSARVQVQEGRIGRVAVKNVPAFLYRSGVEVETPSGPVQLDISFGGNFFALVPAKSLGLEVKLAHLPELIARGMAIRAAIDEQVEVVHPSTPSIWSRSTRIWKGKRPTAATSSSSVRPRRTARLAEPVPVPRWQPSTPRAISTYSAPSSTRASSARAS
jgi:proline racemase